MIEINLDFLKKLVAIHLWHAVISKNYVEFSLLCSFIVNKTNNINNINNKPTTHLTIVLNIMLTETVRDSSLCSVFPRTSRAFSPLSTVVTVKTSHKTKTKKYYKIFDIFKL